MVGVLSLTNEKKCTELVFLFVVKKSKNGEYFQVIREAKITNEIDGVEVLKQLSKSQLGVLPE